MRGELDQLRATVKHLGSEVIQLRAQMANLRRLPVPPDAAVMEATGGRAEVTAAVERPQTDHAAVADNEIEKTEARLWAPQLVTKAVATPASVGSSRPPVSDGSPAVEARPVALTPESVDRGGDVESTVDDTPDNSEPEATPVEAASDTVVASVDEQLLSPTTAVATESAREVDEPEAGLELFASESAPDGDDQPAEDKKPGRRRRGGLS